MKNPNNLRIPKKLAELHENQLENNLVMSELEFNDHFNLNEKEEQLMKLVSLFLFFKRNFSMCLSFSSENGDSVKIDKLPGLICMVLV